jgi:hypothetical protein
VVERRPAFSRNGTPSKVTEGNHVAVRLELGIPFIPSAMLHGMPFSGTNGPLPMPGLGLSSGIRKQSVRMVFYSTDDSLLSYFQITVMKAWITKSLVRY